MNREAFNNFGEIFSSTPLFWGSARLHLSAVHAAIWFALEGLQSKIRGQCRSTQNALAPFVSPVCDRGSMLFNRLSSNGLRGRLFKAERFIIPSEILKDSSCQSLTREIRSHWGIEQTSIGTICRRDFPEFSEKMNAQHIAPFFQRASSLFIVSIFRR